MECSVKVRTEKVGIPDGSAGTRRDLSSLPDGEEPEKPFFAHYFIFFKAVLCLCVRTENFSTFVLQYAHEDSRMPQIARLQVPCRPQH